MSTTLTADQLGHLRHFDNLSRQLPNDAETDAAGNRVEMEPMTGNMWLGYARLDVPDGLWGAVTISHLPGRWTVNGQPFDEVDSL